MTRMFPVLILYYENVELRIVCVLGIKSPDTALYESLKLLCSLLVTLVGNGLYRTNSKSSSDIRFINQGMSVYTFGLTVHGEAC